MAGRWMVGFGTVTCAARVLGALICASQPHRNPCVSALPRAGSSDPQGFQPQTLGSCLVGSFHTTLPASHPEVLLASLQTISSPGRAPT